MRLGLGACGGEQVAVAGELAQLALRDNEAIGTSSDYQRYFMKGGKRHPHIIDPRSGNMIDLVASVTVITSGASDAGLRSDGNTKPLFITGPAHWEAMAAQMGLKEMLLIGADKKVVMRQAGRGSLEPVTQACRQLPRRTVKAVQDR